MEMFALIPHSTEQKILAVEQKKILRQLNDSQLAYEPIFPLWIFFDFDNLIFEAEKKDKKNNINIEEKIATEEFFRKALASVLADLPEKKGTAEIKKLLQEINIFSYTEGQGNVFFPTEIAFRNGEVLQTQINFAKARRPPPEAAEKASLPATSSLPKLCRCKIFRLAQTECEVALGGTKIWSIAKSCWVKL